MRLLATFLFLMAVVSCTSAANQALIESTCNKELAESGIEKHSGVSTSQFNLHFDSAENRKIVIFFDGTGNDKSTNTNIWQLYKLSVRQACNGNAIVPYYVKGVGTDWYNSLLGGAFGKGVDENIKQAYQFLVEHYKPNDQLFLFGFSRGAYTARSLNGMIEFANLLDIEKIDKNHISREVKKVFGSYNTLNDGKPDFEERLYEKLQQQFTGKTLSHKVKVTAIGVFDTVPALGIGRDDFPDGHRTNLYATHGFHALSLNEQRNDFRLLRFDTFPLKPEQSLSEVWFAGAHADIGGGYNDFTGLESVTRQWMLTKFKAFDIFPSQVSPDCSKPASCELAELHDEFLDTKLYSELGISRRKPDHLDIVHGSVLCRLNAKSLALPHKYVEPSPDFYQPENIRLPISEHYKIETYPCSMNKAEDTDSITNNN